VENIGGVGVMLAMRTSQEPSSRVGSLTPLNPKKKREKGLHRSNHFSYREKTTLSVGDLFESEKGKTEECL